MQQLVSQLPWSRNICIGNSPTACWTTAPPCPLSQQAAALFADGPSIGLILCKTKGKITAEYALRDVNKPLGISTYQLAEGLPADLKGQLHSIEALEEELARMDGDNDE